MQRWWILLATGAVGVGLATLLIVGLQAGDRPEPTVDPTPMADPAPAPAPRAATAAPSAGSTNRPPATVEPLAPPDRSAAQPAEASPAPSSSAARSPHADLPPEKVLLNEADAALIDGDSVTADALLTTVIDDPETSAPIRAFAQYRRASVLVDLGREDEARELLQIVIDAPMGNSTQERWLRDQARQDLAEMQ